MTASTNKTVIKIVVASMAVLLVLLIVALIINLVRLSAERSRLEELTQQSAQLDKEIDDNGRMMDWCESSEFIEDFARKRLDMIYRGEITIGVK